MTSLLRRTGFGLKERLVESMFGKGHRFDFLRPLMVRDWATTSHDFLNKALDTTNLWTVAAGGTATTWAILADVGGWIRGITGTTAATSGLQFSLATKFWKGANGAGLLALVRLSVITEIRLEIGFVDALPAVNTTIINSLATPTLNTTASGAIFVYDHTGSTTTIELVGIGTGVAANKTTIASGAPVAATLYSVYVQMIGTSAFVYLNDADIPVASVAIKDTDGVFPAISVKKSDTTTCNVDVDCFVPMSGRVG